MVYCTFYIKFSIFILWNPILFIKLVTVGDILRGKVIENSREIEQRCWSFRYVHAVSYDITL